MTHIGKLCLTISCTLILASCSIIDFAYNDNYLEKSLQQRKMGAEI